MNCPHCLTRGWRSELERVNPERAILQRLKCPYCKYEQIGNIWKFDETDTEIINSWRN